MKAILKVGEKVDKSKSKVIPQQALEAYRVVRC
jgi:hypothetical protein